MQKENLSAVVNRLDDPEKALISLYFEDILYAEISAITAINENYVSVQLNRIKIKIQKFNQNYHKQLSLKIYKLFSEIFLIKNILILKLNEIQWLID